MIYPSRQENVASSLYENPRALISPFSGAINRGQLTPVKKKISHQVFFVSMTCFDAIIKQQPKEKTLAKMVTHCRQVSTFPFFLWQQKRVEKIFFWKCACMTSTSWDDLIYKNMQTILTWHTFGVIFCQKSTHIVRVVRHEFDRQRVFYRGNISRRRVATKWSGVCTVENLQIVIRTYDIRMRFNFKLK